MILSPDLPVETRNFARSSFHSTLRNIRVCGHLIVVFSSISEPFTDGKEASFPVRLF